MEIEQTASPAVTEESDPSTEQTTGEKPEESAKPESDTGKPEGDQATAGTTEAKEPEPQQKVVKEVIGLRKRAQTAEQEAAYWRGVAEGRNKPGETPGSTRPQPGAQAEGPPKPPDVSVFGDDWQSYEAAKDQYLIDKAKWDMRQEWVRDQAARGQTEVDRTFNERISKAAEADPEIGMVLNAVNPADPYFLPISPNMAEVIKHSEAAPKIIRFLLDNKGEAQRLFRLNPFVAAAELGKIEAKIAGEKPVQTQKISQAPEPVKPVSSGTSGVTVVEDESLPMDEWIMRRNKRVMQAGGV